MEKDLIIIGDSLFAEIAYEYFTHDSDYCVKAFVVEKEFRQKNTLFDIPVVDFEDVEESYKPDEYHAFVALAYGQLNHTRARLLSEIKLKGYSIASYISSRAFVWKNVKMGENTFIFENNVVQPFVELGDNNILWSGNHIGHHTKIGHNNFISSHVVMSGCCNIADNNFFGVNSTIGNNINIGSENWIGADSRITKNINNRSLLAPKDTDPSKIDTYRFFKMKE